MNFKLHHHICKQFKATITTLGIAWKGSWARCACTKMFAREFKTWDDLDTTVPLEHCKLDCKFVSVSHPPRTKMRVRSNPRVPPTCKMKSNVHLSLPLSRIRSNLDSPLHNIWTHSLLFILTCQNIIPFPLCTHNFPLPELNTIHNYQLPTSGNEIQFNFPLFTLQD